VVPVRLERRCTSRSRCRDGSRCPAAGRAVAGAAGSRSLTRRAGTAGWPPLVDWPELSQLSITEPPVAREQAALVGFVDRARAARSAVAAASASGGHTATTDAIVLAVLEGRTLPDVMTRSGADLDLTRTVASRWGIDSTSAPDAVRATGELDRYWAAGLGLPEWAWASGLPPAWRAALGLDPTRLALRGLAQRRVALVAVLGRWPSIVTWVRRQSDDLRDGNFAPRSRPFGTAEQLAAGDNEDDAAVRSARRLDAYVDTGCGLPDHDWAAGWPDGWRRVARAETFD